MNYQELINEKHSVREYKNKELSTNLLEEIKQMGESCERLIKDIKVKCEVVENKDGLSEKLNGVCGYKGIMIDAPYYLLVYSEEKSYYLENAGYVGELMSLKMFEKEVDSCFITFSDGKKVSEIIGIDTELSLSAILGFGYGKNARKIFSLTKTGGNYSKAKFGLEGDDNEKFALTELVYDKEWGKEADYDMLKNRMLDVPLFYSRLAPSSYNRQPWRFILDKGTLVLALEQGSSDYNDSVDAGIQMLYFDLVISETLMDITWNMGKPEKQYIVPDNYEIVAYTNI